MDAPETPINGRRDREGKVSVGLEPDNFSYVLGTGVVRQWLCAPSTVGSENS